MFSFSCNTLKLDKKGLRHVTVPLNITMSTLYYETGKLKAPHLTMNK